MHNKPQKPDFTAWFVLQGLVAAMHHPDFSAVRNNEALRLYEILTKACSKTRLMSKFFYHLPYAMQYRLEEIVTAKGRPRHFFLRKREIEKQVRNLLATNTIQQMVVLGSGLETLCNRLAKEFPAVRFIEIDMPATQQFKISALRDSQVESLLNLEYIEGDLRNPLADILSRTPAFEQGKPTIWLAEGFFMFIPEDGVKRIFKEIHSLSAAGSHFIFTTIPHIQQGSAFSRKLQKLYMKKEKCSFAWEIPIDQVADFVGKYGFLMVGQTPYEVLHKGYIGQNNKVNERIGEDIHIAKC